MSEHVEDLIIGLKGDVTQYVSAMDAAERAGKAQARQAQNIVRQNGAVTRSHGSVASAIRSSSIVQAASLGAIVYGYKSVATAAANYDTTLRQIAVASGTAVKDVPRVTKSLGDLAIKLGKDTVFSAQDAAAAMLELAKGGLTTAQIQAGATASTLTLASAGGLQLADAAGYIVQGLTTFNLTAKDSAGVAAALAGGANASTASVQDMGLALSQVGPSAVNAGLTLQDTTAVLAAFANNGIKGSDAGTSLKTMLARLVPQTDKQASAMKHLGLSFVDAHGNFKDIADIAQDLHDKLGPLSEAQRTQALNTIFGSDAQRAASILAKEGAKGIRDLTKATSDKTQADKLAKAATSGSAGALSQLSGSIDTAKLQIGEALTPLTVDLANHMTGWANTITDDVIPAVADFVKGMEDGHGAGGDFADTMGDIGSTAKDAWHSAQPIFSFIGDHPDLFKTIAKDALIFAGAMKAVSTVKKIPGLGSLGGGFGGGSLGGLTGSVGRPVPVFVTNEGFAGGGVGGAGGASGPGRIARGAGILGAGGLGVAFGTQAGTSTGSQLTSVAGAAATGFAVGGPPGAIVGAVASAVTIGFQSGAKEAAENKATFQAITSAVENATSRADLQSAVGPNLWKDATGTASEYASVVAGINKATFLGKDLQRQIITSLAETRARYEQLDPVALKGAQIAQEWADNIGDATYNVSFLKAALDNLPKRIQIGVELATHQTSLHAAEHDLSLPAGTLALPTTGRSNPATRDNRLVVEFHGPVMGAGAKDIATALEPHITAAQNEQAARWGDGTVRSVLAQRY